MTKNEILNMFLSKNINKKDYSDVITDLKNDILAELGIIDKSGKMCLSEELKTEIRNELKTIILNIFFDDTSNQEYFSEVLNRVYTNADSNCLNKACTCKCEEHKDEISQNTTPENKIIELSEKLSGKPLSDIDKENILEAYNILQKIF